MTLIPFDDRDGTIWFNGKLVPWREAKIHTISHGLHYASCVFEGERAYNGKIFKSREHSERLIRSANILDMEIPYSVDELEKAKAQILKENNLQDAYVRVAAFRGSEQMGVSAANTKTNVVAACWGDWASYFDPHKRDNGIVLKTSKWRKPAPDTAPTESKASALYAVGTIVKHSMEREGADDALMLDYRGQVAEATGANFFMVRNGVLKTPIADCFLNGITRQTVIQLAKDLSIPVEETVIMPEEIKNADEVFLTGTAAEITAVGKIDDMTFTVGPITKKIREAYAAMVRGE